MIADTMPHTGGAPEVIAMLVISDDSGATHLHLGTEVLAVLVCVGVVAWRRSLLPGLVCAAILVATARWLGGG